MLFEKEGSAGGHAHTEYVGLGKKKVPIDTGFEVYNPETYPHLVEFFKRLGVRSQKAAMNLSVSTDDGAFEFSNRMPNGIFADRGNLISPSFYIFLLEVLRFNRTARAALKKGIPPKQTLRQFLRRNRFSKDLAERYVFPMVGSIWSTPQKLANDFPALALLTFLNNHRLFSATNHAKWYTVKGGSAEYVRRAVRDIRKRGGIVKTHCPVQKVTRHDRYASVRVGGRELRFDYVVMATHADTTLRLLADPTRVERKLLSMFSYETNKVVLHRDPSLMPRHKAAWSAWNFIGTGGARSKKVCLTYYINELTGLDERRPIFTTLNPYKHPKASLTYKTFTYAHPLYTVQSAKAQKDLPTLQGKNRTLFCGAYFGYGFHEDGITSAIAVARYLGISPPWKKKKPHSTSR
jgi:predicted NAD/FAD-binding protein